MINEQGIVAFVRTLADPQLLALRDDLKEKLLTNTRLISLSTGGKAIGQMELVDSSTLMGIVAAELQRRGLVPVNPAPARRTVARFE